jgi:hypothetical protein
LSEPASSQSELTDIVAQFRTLERQLEQALLDDSTAHNCFYSIFSKYAKYCNADLTVRYGRSTKVTKRFRYHILRVCFSYTTRTQGIRLSYIAATLFHAAYKAAREADDSGCSETDLISCAKLLRATNTYIAYKWEYYLSFQLGMTSLLSAFIAC